jgi:zinc-ribbon domain
MSEPEIEIARRCTFCGVSVRQHAMFCPQCGNPVKQQSAPTSISLSETIIDPAPVETLPPPVPKPVIHKPADHSVRSRVEHIRKVSSVMIDQAAYDPSLRFLLVAAAFFLLFLVLLILSKVIG